MENMYRVSDFNYESCLQSQFLAILYRKRSGCCSFLLWFTGTFPPLLIPDFSHYQINFKRSM